MLKPVLNAKTWDGVNAHKSVACSFPNSALHVAGGASSVSVHLTLNHLPWQEPSVAEEPVEDDREDAVNEIDELNLFYAEKFQGNI
jgi:hypothetical protein